MHHILSNAATREFAAKLDALGRSQALIDFELDGTIVTANGNFLQVMGYNLAEVQGRHHSMFVEPAVAQGAEYRAFWEALRRGEFQSAEFKRLGKNGREVWIRGSYNPILDRAGRPYKVVKFATEVTREKMASAELRGQVDAIGKAQAVIEFNLDGTILDANDNFLGTVGYALDEIRGRHHAMFVDPAQRDGAEYREFWARLNRGEYQAAEYRRLGRNGREIWLQASYNPILDLNGRPYKVVKFATDVTAQVRARLRNEQVRAEVEQSLGGIERAISTASARSASAAGASTQTNRSVQSVASGAEQLSISVREISESMVKSKAAVDGAFDQAMAADEASRKLTDAARSIGSIVDLIRNIASQINLLSLNATIESARAGEAGRGFAVVANEVKNLANQASRATENIGGEIEGIQAVAAAVADALAAIKVSIGAVQEHVTATAGAVEQQSAVTRDMSANMQAAAQAMDGISSNVGDIADATRDADAATRSVQDTIRALTE